MAKIPHKRIPRRAPVVPGPPSPYGWHGPRPPEWCQNQHDVNYYLAAIMAIRNPAALPAVNAQVEASMREAQAEADAWIANHITCNRIASRIGQIRSQISAIVSDSRAYEPSSIIHS